MEKLRSIQCLRALAALAVVSAHAAGIWERLSGTPIASGRHVGVAGVDLFFVISGFIVTRMALGAGSATQFWGRRFTRVAPVYYLSAIPWAFVSALTGPVAPQRWITSLSFWPVMNGQFWAPLNPVGWTLSFEMLFYSAVALCIAFRRSAIFALLAAMTTLWCAQAFSPGALLNFAGSPLFAEFLMGAAIAAFWRRARPTLGMLALAYGVLLFGAWAILGCGLVHDAPTIVSGHLGWTRVAMFGAPALAVVWGALQIEVVFRGRWANGFVLLGDASFSLYLCHTGVLELVALSPLNRFAPAVLMVIATSLTVPVALAAYFFVERPVLALLSGRRRHAKVLTAAA